MKKYRAVKDPRHNWWLIQQSTIFGWKLIDSASTQDDAQRALDGLVSPQIIYPRSATDPSAAP